MEHKNHKLVILMPALNEEKTIGNVIANIPPEIPGIKTIEVIVVDDGSSDATVTVARKAGAIVLSGGRHSGLGVVFKRGIHAALRRGADIIVNIDSDGQFNPTDIPQLIAPIQRGAAQFVTTTRFARPELIPDMPVIKRLGNGWMTWLINFITGKKFTDVSCGFRAYTRDAALHLTLFGRFTYTQESFIDLAYKDIVMAEVPLKVRGEREHGHSRLATNLWRYGLKSATIIFRAARDYQPFYFFGVPGIILFLCGVASGIFLLVHFIQTGQTYPYRSLVQVSGVFIIVGFLMFFISMLADMQHRNRMLLEEMLYQSRKKTFAQSAD